MNRIWDNGFRQITSSGREISTPEDLEGFRLRVPPAPALTSLFKALDAAPSPINFNELYTALQTKVVEGQEKPLAIIAHRAALRGAEELQPDRPCLGRLLGTWQQAAFETLPEDLRRSSRPRSTSRDRPAGGIAGSANAATDLRAKGQFIDVDQEAFRKALARPLLRPVGAKYGDTAWKLLEQVSGKLG